MSLEEFRAAPAWRRVIERIYRHPAGFGLYYAVERWWRHKFLPSAETPGIRDAALRDVRFLLVWSLLITLGPIAYALHEHRSVVAALAWGAAAPFITWNYLMGTTAFLQHTHPRAKWTNSPKSPHQRYWQAQVTVRVEFPVWYDVLSHNIMHHPAHHLNPRVPWHNLSIFTSRLEVDIGCVKERMSLLYPFRIARTCKLYDYVNGKWLDFEGRPTTNLL
jgi:omega-6 fatty acid desaturase (delta-12 desaturase)